MENRLFNQHRGFLSLFVFFLLVINSLATITTFEQVTNEDGSIQWDWVTNIPSGSSKILVGYDTSGTLDVSGNSTSFDFYQLFIAAGDNTTARFTMRNGASLIHPFYQNHYIYIASGIESQATMTFQGIDTYMRLSDHIYVGHKEGAHGEFIVKDGAVFEYSELYAGYARGSYGKVIVDGLGSQLVTWVNNKYTRIGNSGKGELVIRNKGYARTDGEAVVGYADRSHGTATITGKDSLWEIPRTLTVGRGGGFPSQPAEGVLILARGGKVVANSANIGGSSYGGLGTLGFVIGDTGTGAVNCGLLETSSVMLPHADLEMHIDPGINLTIGTQYTLIDYGTLGSGALYKQFTGINEGDIYTCPEEYHFRIHYATDLGGGDLAITATVTELPPCVVDDIDLYLIGSRWLENGCGGPDWCGGADIDGNATVGLNDFVQISQYWMSSCPVNWPWQ